MIDLVKGEFQKSYAEIYDLYMVGLPVEAINVLVKAY